MSRWPLPSRLLIVLLLAAAALLLALLIAGIERQIASSIALLAALPLGGALGADYWLTRRAWAASPLALERHSPATGSSG